MVGIRDLHYSLRILKLVTWKIFSDFAVTAFAAGSLCCCCKGHATRQSFQPGPLLYFRDDFHPKLFLKLLLLKMREAMIKFLSTRPPPSQDRGPLSPLEFKSLERFITDFRNLFGIDFICSLHYSPYILQKLLATAILYIKINCCVVLTAIFYL
jgi:hypothetical protein